MGPKPACLFFFERVAKDKGAWGNLTFEMSMYPELQFVLTLIWVVVKIMVTFLVLRVIRHLVLRGPKKGP